jgi:hypothetical protein
MESTMQRTIETATTKKDVMKALAVIPGKPNTIHLPEVPKPRVEDVPEGRGVLIKVLNVGVDGTDKEINAAEYGAAPSGDDYLIIGHESFGRVESVGPNVSEFRPGDFVSLTVRRPGSSLYDQIGTYDMTTDDVYFETGVKDLSTAELQYPGWPQKLLTHPVKGLENYGEMIRLLTETKGAIKVYFQVAAANESQVAAAG